jgi:RNA-directed DNA polymerase
MGKLEPHTEVGSSSEHRNTTANDPISKRALIAAKARNNPKLQFVNLMHHLTPKLIEESLNKIPKKSAVGVDGMTVEQAKKNLDWILPPLLKRIHNGQYEAPPVKRVYIPKTDGNMRPIGVPEVIDRSLQAAMSQILNEVYEQDFLPCSFGFRPGLGCHHALTTLCELVADIG